MEANHIGTSSAEIVLTDKTRRKIKSLVFTANVPAQTYSVTSTTGKGVVNPDGAQTITTTATTATFSIEESNLGQFLSATVQTTTMTVASNGSDTSLKVGPSANRFVD